jgi:prepilin signal peptidase PulO-like enzyme (type II secretory pathway)
VIEGQSVLMLGASLAFYQWSLALTGLAFVFALGAIVGSFLNVVVYRLPEGIGLITPPSRCPHCLTRLGWRENVPIFGWLWLGGKCRTCKAPISCQYPLVELLVAVLFSVPYVIWFMRPSVLTLVGIDPVPLTPDWALDGFARMWPQLVVVWSLTGALVAITLIDARTFMIPAGLPRYVIAVSVLAHPLHALWIQHSRGGGLTRSEAVWAIPVVEGPWLGLALAGTAGLILSEILLRLRVLPMPFADYDAWAASREAEAAAASPPLAAESAVADEPSPPAAPASSDPASSDGPAPGHVPPAEHGSLSLAFRRAMYLTAPAIALMFAGYGVGLGLGRPLTLTLAGLGVGLLLGMLLRRLVPDPAADERDGTADPEWVLYPHARREMGKELLLVLPVLVCGGLGWWLASPGRPLAGALADPPLWLLALGGSLLGLLVGGGVVWAVRILATLLFGKEAMGFGDVHLMAAVGAATGWLVPILAFFTAPFPALLWAAASVLAAPLFKRQGTAMPFGPHLAAATLFVVFAWPIYEWGARILAGPQPLP